MTQWNFEYWGELQSTSFPGDVAQLPWQLQTRLYELKMPLLLNSNMFLMNGAKHFLQSLAHRGPDTMTCRQTHGRGGHGSGVDSGKFLLFYFGPRSGFKIFWETAPRVALVFSSSMSSCCLYKKSLLNYKHCWISVASKVAVVRTGVGFSSLKKNQIRIRFQKFCNRSRVEVWKYDSIHPGTSAHSNNNKRHVLETATTHIPTKSRLASSVWWWPAM